MVGAATGGSVDQHASRVLERRSRQPAITPDTHLGDTKQQLRILGWRLALGNELLVGIDHRCLGDDVAHDEGAVAWIIDLHPAKHLPDDDLKVLASHILALRSIDAEHFVNDVALGCLCALEAHEVVQVERTKRQAITWLDHIARLNDEVHRTRNLVADWCCRVACEDKRITSGLNHSIKRCSKWLCAIVE